MRRARAAAFLGAALALAAPAAVAPAGPASAAASASGTVVTISPEPLYAGVVATVHVTGAPASLGSGVVAWFCALPVGPTVGESHCSNGAEVALDATGNGSGAAPVWSFVATGPGPGDLVDCRVGDCGVVVFHPEGGVLASAPLVFGPVPEVTLTPSAGLTDGEAIAVTGSGLPAGAYRLLRCHAIGCEAGEPVTVGAAGTLATTIPARQRFVTEGWRQGVYCRDACHLRLETTFDLFGVERGYAMAEGELAVAPDSGLADGQVVEVTGDDLMATYPGPPVLGMPTGGWALTQCAAAVLDHPSLFGVFTHCATPPPTRPVEVPGSTLATTFPVAATITRILGGTTDCRAAPCVVGLVRFEQDGSLSHHLRPVTFG